MTDSLKSRFEELTEELEKEGRVLTFCPIGLMNLIDTPEDLQRERNRKAVQSSIDAGNTLIPGPAITLNF